MKICTYNDITFKLRRTFSILYFFFAKMTFSRRKCNVFASNQHLTFAKLRVSVQRLAELHFGSGLAFSDQRKLHCWLAVPNYGHIALPLSTEKLKRSCLIIQYSFNNDRQNSVEFCIYQCRDVNISFFCEQTFRGFLSLRKKVYFVSFLFLNLKKSKDLFIVY